MAFARAARIALDLSLISIRTVCPVLSRAWIAAKGAIGGTPAKPIVDNYVISKLEVVLENGTKLAETKMHEYGNKLVPAELRYLEGEILKLRKRMESCRLVKPAVSSTWKYMKVECIPPMTKAFFGGPIGQKLEDMAAKTADGICRGLENQIKNMDMAEAQEKALKEALRKEELELQKRAELMKKHAAILRQVKLDNQKAADAKAKAELERVQKTKQAQAEAAKKSPKPPQPDKTKKKPAKKHPETKGKK